MKITLSIFLYILIIISVLQGWLLVAGFTTLLFSVRYGAGALIVLAVCIDGYFGNFYSIPYLSLFSVWWYLLVYYLRPKIVNLKFV